eukprot:XP_011665437.1 PREDICTED: uncharacterized protein LOC100892527 [Strongylocentrotus purpuratus]
MAAGKHLILATIVEVLPGQLTYPACVTCYTKLHRLGSSDQFQCQRCGKVYEAKQVHQRYRLAIKVMNQSVCREVTVFGSCLDPLFGIDATTFSRYTQHAVHHQTGCNELELLHASVTKTLVGHPFYFGFKASANFSVQSNDYTDSYASLANIVARDHENLVAVQMTSPFQKWNFPTIVQYLSNIMSNRNSQLVEKGGYVQCCSKDECDICPLIAVPQNKNEGLKSVNVQETIDDSEKREVNMPEGIDLTYLTCSKKDATRDEGSRETSLLGETFLSCSLPSFRLSCDKNLSAINGAICSRLSNGSDHPRYSNHSDSSGTKHYVESVHCEMHKESCNLPICTIDSNVGHQGTSMHNVHESKSVKECIPNAAKDCANLCIKDDLLVEGCRKSNQKPGSRVTIVNNAKDECAMNKPEDSRRMENIAVDTCGIDGRSRDAGMTIDSRNKGLEQDAVGTNDSSMVQECEQYMNKWLEENSFDGWSYHEPIQHLGKTPGRSPCLNDKAVEDVPPCNEEDRDGYEANRTSQPDLSHESMCNEFPEDLPFSEDLNQFLHDVEEEHGQSRERDVGRRRHPAQKDSTCISTIGSDKEITPVSKCEWSSAPNGETGSTEENFSHAEFSYHSERTESGINSSMCNPAGTSGLVKGDTETDMCYAKERECKESPVCDIQCNTAQEEGKELKKTQLIRDKLEDLNNRSRKRVDDNVCDDGRVLSKTSLQNEERSCNGSTVGEVELDSAWSEDCSQSPLLFSQSQSPILPAMPSRHLTSQRYRSQNGDRLSTPDIDNSLPVQHRATPQLRLDFNLSGQKLTVNKPNDRNIQGENFCGDLQSPDQGTPCLFSQAQDDPVIPSQHSSIPVIRNSRRAFHSRQRTTPLRQLFMQRASSWKMSSTPMTSKKKTILERSFESPLSCATPSLFSSENSPDVGGTSSNLGQVNRSKEYSQREASIISNSFECTPDLF